MTPKRIFYVMLGGVVALLLLCFAATYFANKMIQSEGTTLLGLKEEQAVLNKQSAALSQARKDIAQYEELEAIAKSVVPQEKDQARTVLELVRLAEESGISLTSIDFPESLLGEAAKKSASKDSKAPTNTVDSNTTQLTPLSDLKGVYVMEIRIQSDSQKPISYGQLLDYLQRLEKNRRTAQVIDIGIQPSQDNRNLVTFSLVLNSYVKP